MVNLPGTLQRLTLCQPKLPEQEYDSKGIPIGILPDTEHPYLDSLGRSRQVYVYRPASIRPMLLAHSLYVVSEAAEQEEVEQLLCASGLVDLAERESAFVIFLVPGAGGWNTAMDPARADDADVIHHVLLAGRQWYLFTGRENGHDFLMGLIGCGAGAEMAQLAVARHPEHVNALLTFGGSLTAAALEQAGPGAPLSVWQVDPGADSAAYWRRVNGLRDIAPRDQGNTHSWTDPDNAAKQVRVSRQTVCCPIDGGMLLRFWDEVYADNVRVPSMGVGDVFNMAEIERRHKPVIHINDRCLGDNGGAPHNWYEFIPESVVSRWGEPGYRCPLIIELHGGGCWPRTACAKVQFQELGREKGFISVYANASVENSWNSNLLPHRLDDTAFITALTKYLLDRYPIDPARVYISGFSNGSGMAHVMAALRPDLYAGLIAFNTRYHFSPTVAERSRAAWGGSRRMPVFSVYGTLDAEYPMTEGCGQFTQMHFWKQFNNIPDPPLRENDASGVGAAGDSVVRWGPADRNGDPLFTTHRYMTSDQAGLYLYNYTLVKNLPHTVERRVIPLAWEYISRFARQADGRLEIKERDPFDDEQARL
ncbi:MAG TPA: hypothetical protein H9795_04645 [Candidatus Fournierella merdigallinarum]|nr:hypothetical protein [Candidatus Fournierella merdigallinarum]